MTDPYNGSAPFEAGSSTSKAAADAIEPARATLRMTVFCYIRSAFDGLTDDEIEIVSSLPHQTASARRRELVLSGHIEDSGKQRSTRSGRMATVWTVVPRDQREAAAQRAQDAARAQASPEPTHGVDQEARRLLREASELLGHSPLLATRWMQDYRAWLKRGNG